MEQNKALLERIRLFVLDLDGTIYLGDRLLPGAAEFIATAKEKGRRVLFFTNNTSRSPMEYVERLSRMGIPVTREDILTAGDVTIHYLQTHCAGQSVYLLGVPALRQSFAEAGISLTEEQPDLVVVGFDKTLTYERLEKACIHLRRGAHFLATHPDINCPTEAEPIPDCGAICQAITASTGFAPRSLGKPAAETVELVEAVSGLPREAIAFVGHPKRRLRHPGNDRRNHPRNAGRKQLFPRCGVPLSRGHGTAAVNLTIKSPPPVPTPYRGRILI